MENKLTITIDKCDDETFKKLGDKIKTLRSSRGMSQEVLSKITHRDRSGLSGYERGVRVPTLHSLYDISNALNYSFKIQFEKKEGLVDMYRKETFTKEFMDKFMDNLYKEDTFESWITKSENFGKEKWQVTELTKDKVTVESNLNNTIKLTVVKLDHELSNKRYIPIEIESITENKYRRTYRYFIDLKDLYSLTDIYFINKRVLECVAVTGMIQASNQLEFEVIKDMKNDFIDHGVLTQIYFTSYCDLKTTFGLNDKEILDIIKVLGVDTRGSNFIDVLNSDASETIRMVEEFDESLSYVKKNYLDTGYINEKVLAELLRVAILEKLSDFSSVFLYDGDNDELEEEISIGENERFMNLISNETDKSIVDCFKYLDEKYMYDDRCAYETIKEIICIFYKEIYVHHLEDTIDNALWKAGC